jgi:RNA polymerase sigma-70 factor (TIGR02943 family)
MDKSKLFKNIIDQFTTPLFNRAKYLISNTEDAEDLVQEVFIIAYNSYEKFEGKSNIKSWLLGILNHKVADYYRKKYKNFTSISLDHYFDEEGSWKKDQILKDWDDDEISLMSDPDFRPIFDDCIDKLPEKWKIPFKMYYLEEKKTEFVSQEIGITATNIWKILQRGRLQLKDCLELNWFNK